MGSMMKTVYPHVKAHKATLIIIVAIAETISLTGCTPKSEPKTVEYYLENDDERTTLMAKCSNDLGTHKDDPDCINASQASLQARAKHKWIK